MKSRSLVVAGALVLALLATAGVFLYVSNVKEEAETGGALTTVLVSTTDIPAGTDLNPLADQGAFTPKPFPADSVVQGAVTSVGQLRDRAAAVPILAGEQIALSRLSGTQEKLPGGVFGLQEGYQAVTVRLTAEQMLGESVLVLLLCSQKFQISAQYAFFLWIRVVEEVFLLQRYQEGLCDGCPSVFLQGERTSVCDAR